LIAAAASFALTMTALAAGSGSGSGSCPSGSNCCYFPGCAGGGIAGACVPPTSCIVDMMGFQGTPPHCIVKIEPCK